MPNCDMCGKETELYKAIVEGATINVCQKCAKYGKVIKKVELPKKQKIEPIKSASQQKEEQETIYLINPEYASLIKKKRELLKLSQEEFAKKINEKESLIHKMESNKFEPSLQLAIKIEKFLHIKLIEAHQESKVPIQKTKSDTFTIGDFIKVKK